MLICSEFKCLRNVVQQRLQTLKSQMPRRESARRQHPLAREFDIIETVNMRLSLMQTMFSKHIERGNCAFFAGQVLDEVHHILNYLKATPVLSFAYKVTDELFDLSTMAVEYFKERIEPTLPDISYISGLNDYFLFDSGSNSSGGSTTGCLDTPGCSKSFENIPEYSSPFSDYSSSLVSHKSSDFSNKSSYDSHHETNKDSAITKTLPLSVSLTRSATRRIKKLEVRNKKANSVIRSLKIDLRVCKRKITTNQKQIQKYRSHFDDYEKKFETTCSKLNSVLEELNGELSKCKTEIQYLRSVFLTPESSLAIGTPQGDESEKKSKRKLEFIDVEELDQEVPIESNKRAKVNE